MSRLNGKFGIVDEHDDESKTIISLKLTDATLKDIIQHKRGDLKIRFADKVSYKVK